MNAVRGILGEMVCKNILFVHAFLGCDTTSRVFGVGKAAGLKLIKDNQQFHSQAETFQSTDTTKDNSIAAGEKAMVVLHKGKETDNLNNMRHQRFQELVTVSKKVVHPNMLPQTPAAVKYHSLRVYHQIQQWKGITLDAEEWGWKMCEGTLVPIHFDLVLPHSHVLN